MSMIDCPFYRGVGICNSGCREEPACVTQEPIEGWLAAEASLFREAAWEYRGVSHGLVKHFRDLMRQAEKREARQRVCRECGCTESYACPGGCAWSPGMSPLGPRCTACRDRRFVKI